MNRTLTLVLPSRVAALVAAVAVSVTIIGVAVADPPRPVPARPDAAMPPPAAPPAATAMPPIVTAAWLAAHLKDPDLVILHVGDADAYRAKHIAGARGVALSDISISMQGAKALHLELPPAEDLRHRLEALGISNDSRVVVYFADDWVSPATRVVFTLDAAGLGAHAALLDGGLAAWLRDGRAVTDAAPPPVRPGTLAPLAIRPIIVDATTVLASLGKPGVAVVDARDKAYYDGTQIGGMHGKPHRTGHIAGALSIPYDSVFDDQGLLRSTDDLTARFAKAGVAPGDTVIGYCHIGQQATAMLFAARRLGHPVLLYDGAFEDWSQFPGYPVETSPGVAADPPAATTADKPPAKAPDKEIDKAKAPDKAPDKAKASDKAPDKAKASDKAPDKAKASDKAPDKAKAPDKEIDRAKASDKAIDKARATQPARQPARQP
jgi:thiosulfate/3-mercaptopyruvate sulfurtransferase